MPSLSDRWVGFSLANGRYQVSACLGDSRLGQVYRARDAKLHTDAVLKVPQFSLLEDPQAVPRFRRAVRTLVRLSHPHIAKVYDLGEHEGLPFVVVQYLPGGTLFDRMTGEDGHTRPMPPEGLRDWLPAVAVALDYLHSEGYVHGDVRPHHILFDAAGHAYLADFSLTQALANDRRSPVSTHHPGTSAYRAPEWAANQACDGRADQYALATTVCEWVLGAAVLGEQPADGGDPRRTQPSAPPNECLPDLPEALAAALLQGLARDPAQRFADCGEFAAAVLAAVPSTARAATPVAAPPPSAPESMEASHPTAAVEPAAPANSVAPVLPVPSPSGNPAPARPPLGLLAATAAALLATMGMLVAVCLGVAGLGSFWLWQHQRPSVEPSQAAGPSPTTKEKEPPARAEVLYPRRLLVININNYLYANPVSKAGLDDAIQQLQESLHISADQTVHLNDYDASEGQPLIPPFKGAIENTLKDFLDGSRAQDRIIILFVGHAVDMDDGAYLVPLAGEIGIKETLIPLAWLYGRLARCRARQKVLIMDVCRLDPGRGRERPGSSALGEKLESLLKQPPNGVQVLAACGADQHSFEGDHTSLKGGVFLHSLAAALDAEAADQKPEDTLPFAALFDKVKTDTAELVKKRFQSEQTPHLAGQELPNGAKYDPNERPAPPVTIRQPPALPGGNAPRETIAAILKETDELVPPAKPNDPTTRVTIDLLPLFSSQALANYQPDNKKTPLRQAIFKAVGVMKVHVASTPNTIPVAGSRLPGAAPNDNAFKIIVANMQRRSARAQLQLEEALKDLEEAGKDRDQELSPRWQANYDYVLARLKALIAYVHEYNFQIGQLRKELPPRDPAVHNSWRLASTETIQSGRETRELAKEAKQLLEKLAKDHPGTPWEVLAKRAQLTALGLQWQAIAVGQNR